MSISHYQVLITSFCTLYRLSFISHGTSSLFNDGILLKDFPRHPRYCQLNGFSKSKDMYEVSRKTLWPSIPKFSTATQPFLRIDMRHRAW